jgi:transcription elongation factor Elf1
MWTCPYCGSNNGVIFKDNQLKGMLCMEQDCGRFNQMDDSQLVQLTEPRNSAISPA